MTKISKDLNKFIFNDLIKESNVFYYKKDGKVYLSDSYFIGIILEDDFLINMDKLKEVDLSRFFENLNIEDYHKIKTWYGKEQYIFLLDENDYKVTCQKKYFKMFKDFDLYIYKDNKPILCLDGDTCIGLILPIKEY